MRNVLICKKLWRPGAIARSLGAGFAQLGDRSSSNRTRLEKGPGTMVQAVRVIRRRGGVVEVVRLLGEAVLSQWQPGDPLAYEATIVWLFPPESLDFARVLWLRDARSRCSPLRLAGPGITLGYSTLTPDAPRHPQTGGYLRRVFYLVYEDLRRNLIDVPAGAVSPEHLLPGESGSPPDTRALLPGYPRSISQHVVNQPLPATPSAISDSSLAGAGQPAASTSR